MLQTIAPRLRPHSDNQVHQPLSWCRDALRCPVEETLTRFLASRDEAVVQERVYELYADTAIEWGRLVGIAGRLRSVVGCSLASVGLIRMTIAS